MKIGVIGLGFVGLSLTSVLASKGFNVVGIDIDKERFFTYYRFYYRRSLGNFRVGSLDKKQIL